MTIIFLILLAGLAVLGIAGAASQYPWRQPVLRPYLGIVLLVAGPLLLIFTVQALYGLPPGSCVERPLNYLPLLLTCAQVAGGVVAAVAFRQARRFGILLAIGLFSLTLVWALVATMSLAGCWI